MSEKTAQYAVDTMLITHVPDDEMGWEMFGLLEAVEFDYERWCRIVGLDPDNPISEAVYDTCRYDWLDAACEVGNDADFEKMMKPYREKWENILHARA